MALNSDHDHARKLWLSAPSHAPGESIRGRLPSPPAIPGRPPSPRALAELMRTANQPPRPVRAPSRARGEWVNPESRESTPPIAQLTSLGDACAPLLEVLSRIQALQAARQNISAAPPARRSSTTPSYSERELASSVTQLKGNQAGVD